MIEFIIGIPVLLLMLLGTLQFGLIYQAKISLNYAAFEVARSGSVNSARMRSMEHAFARALSPLYTNGYTSMNPDGSCSNNYDLDFESDNAAPPGPPGGLGVDNVKCARERVRQMLDNGYARISLVNPNMDSFTDHGISSDEIIPNDSLMYRSAEVKSMSRQTVQDANLIKVHIGLCYELLVPIVDRLMVRMMSLSPNALEPWNFGPVEAGSFAQTCVVNAADPERRGVPIYAQAVMRMQSDAIRDRFCGGQCS